MSKRKKDETSTVEFEVDGIEEAIAPAPGHTKHGPAKPFSQIELPKLEVERPPELEGAHEPEAMVWILERRALGLLNQFKRWITGKTKK